MDRIKKIKDYAFVHFEERDHAVEGEQIKAWLRKRGPNLHVPPTLICTLLP